MNIHVTKRRVLMVCIRQCVKCGNTDSSVASLLTWRFLHSIHMSNSSTKTKIFLQLVVYIIIIYNNLCIYIFGEKGPGSLHCNNLYTLIFQFDTTWQVKYSSLCWCHFLLSRGRIRSCKTIEISHSYMVLHWKSSKSSSQYIEY